MQQMDDGHAEAARAVLIKLAAKYTCDASLQVAAGMALAETGAEKDALPYLDRAHRAKPADSAIAFNLGVAQLKTGDAASAERTFQSILLRSPGNRDVLTALATAQMQQRRFSAAATTYAEVDRASHAASQPVSSEMRQDWASALLSSGKPADAKAVLEKMEGLEQSSEGQAMLADAEEKTGDFVNAGRHYEAAARLNPSEANVYAFGNELLQHWTFPPAIDVFKFGSQNYPDSERMRMALGIAYFGNGNYDQAIPVFQAMLQRSPQNATAAGLLGRSCSATSGDSAPGCAALLTFAEQHPDNAAASLYAATAILRQPGTTRDLVKARKLLNQALAADPKAADSWYQMGVLQQAQNEWEPSAASLQKAIGLRPAYPEAHYRLSRAYGHMGKRDQASAEIALQRQFTEQEKQSTNQRMKDVITFLTAQ